MMRKMISTGLLLSMISVSFGPLQPVTVAYATDSGVNDAWDDMVSHKINGATRTWQVDADTKVKAKLVRISLVFVWVKDAKGKEFKLIRADLTTADKAVADKVWKAIKR